MKIIIKMCQIYDKLISDQIAFIPFYYIGDDQNNQIQKIKVPEYLLKEERDERK